MTTLTMTNHLSHLTVTTDNNSHCSSGGMLMEVPSVGGGGSHGKLFTKYF